MIRPMPWHDRSRKARMAEPTDPVPANTSATLLLRLKCTAPAREFAWREFHDVYSPIIIAFARKMGAKPQDFTDIRQDILLGFFVVSPEFIYDPTKRWFRGYLKTCNWRIFQKRLSKELLFGGRSLDGVDPSESRSM